MTVNDIFRYLGGDNGILPCIKVRKNTQVRLKKGHILRNLSILTQRKDLQKSGRIERKLWTKMVDC